MAGKLTRAVVREEIVRLLVDYLLPEPENQRRADSQVGFIDHYLREVRGYPPDEVKTAMPIVMDELHLLFRAGVLRPGHPNSYELPWFTPTEWGEHVLAGRAPPVYDPDAYLDHLRESVPALSDLVLLYLGEAISTFMLERTVAAAVMLGVATEAVLIDVISAFATWVGDPVGPKLMRSLEREPIVRTYRTFVDALDGIELPAELRRDLDIYLGNVFNFIRMTRNEAGHPTGVTVERSVVEAQLRAFEGYAKRLMALGSYLGGQGPTPPPAPPSRER